MLDFQSGAFIKEFGGKLSPMVSHNASRYPVSTQDEAMEKVQCIFLHRIGERLSFDTF